MLVSVVIPSRERPERLRGCVEQLQKVSPDVEIIIVADIGDDPTVEVAEDLGCKVVIADEPLGPVHCWNIGAAAAEGDAFVLGADDLVFQDGWLEASLKGLNELTGHGLVAFNDLSPLAGKQATHYLISKSYACNEWGGCMAIPAYKQHFIDTEATVRAKRDKCYFYADDAIVEHNHWLWDKADNDETYQRGQESYSDNQDIFKKRIEHGFPNTWKPYFKRFDDEPEDGWGRVAIGARIYRNPHGDFFKSWTFMMLQGLRAGDSVLEPAIGNPAHLAGNKLARGFLNSKCHSVLYVDDDMEFHPSALEKLRSNKENWDCDVVMGFCTHKTIPPHAVVMQLMEQQPGPPLSLKGEHYGSLRDIPDNSVIDVDAVGLAFTLIKRHVVEELVNEYGALYTPFFEWGQFTQGEDVRFSRWCRSNGFKMAVDTNVKVDHLGVYAFGWKDHKSWTEKLRGNVND